MEELKQNVKEYFDGGVPLGTLWEGAKAVMRGEMIQIASHHKKCI